MATGPGGAAPPPGVRPSRTRTAVLAGLALAAVGTMVVARQLGVGEPQGAPGAADSPSPPPGAVAAPAVVPPLLPEPSEVPEELLGGLRFVDATAEAGLPVGERGELRPDDLDGGVAVVDLEGDGDHDLLLTSAGPASGLWRNDGGRFTDATRDAGLHRLGGGGLASATAAVFGDLDADGDLDLFLGGPAGEFGRLLVGDGDGRFVDATRRAGLADPRGQARADQRRIRGADLGDVDGDGDLDLVVTDWNSTAVVAAAAAGSGPTGFETQCEYAAFIRREFQRGELPPTGDTRLLLNDGRGGFADATRAWGLTPLRTELPLTPQLHDLDGDGRLDLVVAGDVCTSRVFLNGGERFVDHTATSGAGGPGAAENGMGSWVRDLDGDARPDWLITSIGYPTADGTCPQVSLFAGCSGNRAYLQGEPEVAGDLVLDDVTDDLGVRDGWWGWGVVAEDFGNDGRLEVVVTNGRAGTGEPVDPEAADVYYDAFRADPTRFFVPDGEGGHVDAAAQVGLRHDDVAFGLVPLDFDGDGRLDLLAANGAAAPTLWRNVSPERHWLRLRLRDDLTGASLLGARVEVTRPDGSTSTQWLHTSGSYQSQRAPEIHVGLGDDSGRSPVRVRVWWPGTPADDPPDLVERLRPDRVHTLTRPTL